MRSVAGRGFSRKRLNSRAPIAFGAIGEPVGMRDAYPGTEPIVNQIAMNANANILIVDDEEVVRRSFAAALAGAHCHAQAAADGDEALRAMEREPFDVVLLDLRMPGPGGLSVLKAMKERWPEREVVIVTGYPSVESAKEAVRLGAYDYLAKPVGPDDIVAATNAAITRKQWALRTGEREETTQHNAAITKE